MEFYNKTKCGVDVADQMARQYSVKAGTRGWPVAAFYNILDLAGVSAFVHYKKRTGDKVSRRDFLFKLAIELREDCIVERLIRNASIARPHSLSTALKKNEVEKRKQCQTGANCSQNKISKLCFKCNKTVCGKCIAKEFSECIACATTQIWNIFQFRVLCLPFFSNKTIFFVNRLIELRDLSICSTFKLHPHHAYTKSVVKTRFRRSGQNDRCWPLRACRNSGCSSVKLKLRGSAKKLIFT